MSLTEFQGGINLIMFGAIYGDIIGSYYEVHCTKNYDFTFHKNSSFTDDSVLTTATCEAILLNPEPIKKIKLNHRALEYAMQYKNYYFRFPHAGYGTMFTEWAKEKTAYPSKQKSFGNGGAMRVVPIGLAYESLEQVLLQAKASYLYTHHHKKAIQSAQVVASAVYLAKHHASKSEIKKFISETFQFNLDYQIQDIRNNYQFDSYAEYSVPPAIVCFLDSHDYESAIRNAISLGGDADTMACIAGGIAQVFYKSIPEHIKKFCDTRLDFGIKQVIKTFEQQYFF